MERTLKLIYKYTVVINIEIIASIMTLMQDYSFIIKIFYVFTILQPGCFQFFVSF